MRREMAEEVAQDVLVWLATDDDLLPIFLGATGAAPDDLRNAVRDPVFLGSVLDFVMMDDAWIRRFCTASGRALTDPQTARRALPGGQDVHWT